MKKINPSEAGVNQGVSSVDDNITQGKSTGNRLPLIRIENEQYTDINDRCVQMQNTLKNIAAMLFVIGISLGAFILIAALEEASTFNELFTMFGLDKWLVKK